jgi:hypothetical protein
MVATSPRVALRIVLLTVVGIALSFAAAAPRSYDALCDEMISFAKLAAQAHNMGKVSDVATYAGKVKAAYKAAVAKDKRHPQAHLNYATYLMNRNEFDTAIKLFKKVLKLIGNDMRARGQIMSNIRRSEYGLLSMKRDAAYDGGKGDIYEAVALAEKQASVSPEPHRTSHDVATMQAMLCEYDTKACEAAGTKFRIATTGSMQHYTNFKSHELQQKGDQRGFLQCSHSRSFSGSWAGSRLVDTVTMWKSGKDVDRSTAAGEWQHRAGGLYMHTFNALTQVVGRDGFVTVPDEAGDCSVFSPASDDYPNVADNVMPSEPSAAPRPGAPVHTVPVVSLVQFAGSSFYHWLAEAVPRLVIAMDHLNQATPARVRFLVPRLTNKTRFIAASFDLLLPDASRYELVEYVPGTKVRQQLSYVTWDRQPCPPAVTDPEGAARSGSNRVCHALAHPQALGRTRAELRKAVKAGPWGKVRNRMGSRLVVFAARGAGVTMRQIDETVLVERLRAVLEQEGSVMGPIEFEVFDNSRGFSFEEALALFSRADVVVGVHGGALSNIIACKPGATLVEIGFAADAAQHYQHMARSLGMTYRRVRAVADSLGRALGAPTIKYSVDGVVDAVRHSLGCWMSHKELPAPAVTVHPVRGVQWGDAAAEVTGAVDSDEL